MLRKSLNALYTGSGWLAAAFLLIICLLVVCQVGLNTIDRVSAMVTGTAVGLTIPSYSDFTGFFLAGSSFLALAYTMRSGAHIRVTLLFSHFPPKLKKFAEGWCLLFAATATIYFSCYTGYLVYESFIYNDLSPGMIAVPLWIPQSAMLLGLVILSISLVDDLVTLFKGGTISYSPDIS
ncbi:MAG: C4-dicarboxylate ABC transporter permease [Desulfobacterales bacterium]|nr:MAG: C4-dicarboxylate ABC transporter permease [Desulfobacterales bacterium]